MRPRKLQIEGLRSYRQAQTIEFESSGLLAITGATGAGKSSILEAMMFALYGVYSGSSKSNKELIADRSDEMRVSLEFEVGGQLYTARRAVGRKGQGSFVLLRGEEVLQHDAHAMTQAVTELLGLDEEQFKKTIFLPQGAFQSFLTSKPRERTELLKRLLQLESLDDLEARLALWAQAARQQVDRAEGFLLQLPDRPAELVERCRQEQAQAEQSWRTIEERFRLLEALREALLGTEREAESRAQQLRVLDGFAELAAVDVAGQARLQAELEGLLGASARAIQLLEQHTRDWQERAPELDEEDLRRLRRDWERWRQQGQQEESLQVEAAALALAQSSLQTRLHQLETGRQPLLERQRELETELEASQQRGEALRQLQDRYETWESQRRGALAELDGARLQLDPLAAAQKAAAETLEQARRAWREAELWRVCGQHRAGQECPVCAQELPIGWVPPAPPGGPELEGAEADWNLARQAWERAAAAVELSEQRLRQLEAEPLEPAPGWSEERQHWSALSEQLKSCRREIHQGDGELASLHRELQQLGAGLERQQTRLSELSAQRGALSASLRQALGDCEEARLNAREELWREHQNRGQELRGQLLTERSRRQDLERRHHLEVEQPQARMEFLRQRCAAALGVEPELELTALLGLWEQECARLRQLLSAGCAEQERRRVELEQGLAEVDAADWESFGQARERAREAVIRCRQALERAQAQAEQAATLEESLAPARLHLDRLQTLTRLLGHQRAKGTRLTFPQWFLQQRQVELLELASQHLEQLSGGQFRFEDDLDDAQSFRVIDMFSGMPRAVTTLSGGETFLASLSLAVALAELVGRRGGQLQALFLDEGFGTLSAECLDRALSALEQLASQDRLIGIISHVPLIAERVEHVWVVRKTPQGSQLVRADEGMRRELVRQELASFDPGLHPLLAN